MALSNNWGLTRFLQRKFFFFCSLLCWCLCAVASVNFDVATVTEINLRYDQSDGVDRYFGYTLLLQKGTHSKIIVGAPKDVNGTGGTVYSCDIKSGSCNKYNLSMPGDSYNFGNFLGGSLDGDERTGQPFIACAPGKEFVYKNKQSSIDYLIGSCYYIGNSSKLDSVDRQISPSNEEDAITHKGSELIYAFAFAEVGIDVHYSKESILLGAPGAYNWQGVAFDQSLQSYYYKKIPSVMSSDSADDFAYIGYTVTKASFDRTGTKNYYVIGGPRGNELRGMVKIFSSRALTNVLYGSEMGCYFGSAILAVDTNGDNIDELFIGAPLGAGSSFDEGYVYVYGKNMVPLLTLSSKKRSARFGSSIVSLGDIDLDSYNDIAIAAPYEDDGVGAVYVYRGNGKSVLETSPSQILTPKDFPGVHTGVRSFGQGLSKGCDIDGNGHNDLAIGAYKSNKVFIIKTLSYIDYQLAVESNVTHLLANVSYTPVNIYYCMYFTQRSKIHDLKSIIFNVTLNLDYRVKGTRTYSEAWTVYLAETFCKTIDILIMQSKVDIQPFQISMKVKAPTTVYATGDKSMERSIPYSHRCGEDNVCQTYITLSTEMSRPYIVIGLDKSFDVRLIANNTNEPGYHCELLLDVPDGIDYESKENCYTDDGKLVCQYTSILISTLESTLKFYVISRTIEVKTIEIGFEVKCLGESLIRSVVSQKLRIVVNNSPYIQGRVEPETTYTKDDRESDYEDFTFTFTIGNYGPSPFRSQIILLLPIIMEDQMKVFELIEAKGTLNGQLYECTPSANLYEILILHPVQLIHLSDLNRASVVSCMTNRADECLQIVCRGGYLYSSSEVARYTVKVKSNLKLLGSHYKNVLNEQDIVAYAVSAVLYNTTTRIETSTLKFIYFSAKISISLWLIILLAILGVMLLLALVFLLHKFHFFDRHYKYKLNDQRLLNKKIEIDVSADNPLNVKEQDD